MRECRSRSMSPEKRASERKTTRREPPETSRRGSEKEKEIAKKLFFRLKNTSKSGRSLIKSDSRENKRKPPVTTTTHFSCSIFASCNLTTAFVQCDPQSMPYFSCSNALFFVLDASTAVVPKDDERRTMRDKVARHIVLLKRGITREELCFFFMTTKISSSLLQSVQKVGGVSLSVQKRSLLGFRTRLSESAESIFFLRRGEIGSEM